MHHGDLLAKRGAPAIITAEMCGVSLGVLAHLVERVCNFDGILAEGGPTNVTLIVTVVVVVRSVIVAPRIAGRLRSDAGHCYHEACGGELASHVQHSYSRCCQM